MNEVIGYYDDVTDETACVECGIGCLKGDDGESDITTITASMATDVWSCDFCEKRLVSS